MDADHAGPIASKLIKRVRALLSRRDHDIGALIEGTRHAQALQKTVASDRTLAGFDPAHAVYVYVQNQVSVLSEQLTALPEMAPFARLVGPAEDEYMPSGPPMSPLTTSYFTSWAFFDAAIGPARETIGTCIVSLLRELEANPEFVRVVVLMQGSRMGVFSNEGREGRAIRLRELLTNEVYRCFVPAGDAGGRRGLWYVRLLPPPGPSFREHVAFTTPYVVLHPAENQWLAYLRRTLPKLGDPEEAHAYAALMKFGLEPRYWPEYVFEAYVNHRQEAIFLAGLPDIEESRSHSRLNR